MGIFDEFKRLAHPYIAPRTTMMISTSPPAL